MVLAVTLKTLNENWGDLAFGCNVIPAPRNRTHMIC